MKSYFAILFKLALKQQSDDILKILQSVMRDAYSNPLSNLWHYAL